MAQPQPTFSQMAAAIEREARWAAESAEAATVLVAKAQSPGMTHEYLRLRRHADALGAAHAIFTGLARYEHEVCRLLELSKRYAGRSRFRWPFQRTKTGG